MDSRNLAPLRGWDFDTIPSTGLRPCLHSYAAPRLERANVIHSHLHRPPLQWELFDDSAHFLFVILAIEDFPFGAAFRNTALLAFDLVTGGLIDVFLFLQPLREDVEYRKPDGIAVFDEVDCIDRSQFFGDLMGEQIDLVASQSHRLQNQLSFSDQFVFDELEHLLIGGAALAHLILILVEEYANFVVEAVFEINFRVHDLEYLFRKIQTLRHFDHFLLDQILHDLRRKQPDILFS